MQKRIYLHWTEEELAYLKENYGRVSQDELVANLRNRNYFAIVKKAQVLGCVHCGFARKKSNLEILLHDNPISYYWIGFLMADGSFTKSKLQLGVATKDLDHLHRFLAYVGSTNSILSLLRGNYHRVSMSNVSVLGRLREKFGISSRKTYEPCPISQLPPNDLLFSLIVGFIDGDGCVCHSKLSPNHFLLSVVGHSSWLENLTFMKRFLYSHLGVDRECSDAYTKKVKCKLPQNKHKTEHELASFYIGHRPTLDKIKEHADKLGLPYLKRKLGKIIQPSE